MKKHTKKEIKEYKAAKKETEKIFVAVDEKMNDYNISQQDKDALINSVLGFYSEIQSIEVGKDKKEAEQKAKKHYNDMISTIDNIPNMTEDTAEYIIKGMMSICSFSLWSVVEGYAKINNQGRPVDIC